MYTLETFEQFCIDLPRIKLFINHTFEDTSDPAYVYALLINLVSDWTLGFQFVFWCTQTALADIYINKLLQLNNTSHPYALGLGDNNNSQVHLLDDGTQINTILTEKEANGSNLNTPVLKLFKPFRVCSISDDDTLNVLCHYHLHVVVTKHTIESHWVHIMAPRVFSCKQNEKIVESLKLITDGYKNTKDLDHHTDDWLMITLSAHNTLGH